MSEALSLSQMHGQVAELLLNAGFATGIEPSGPGLRVFEDAYSVVAVVGFETWERLEDGWAAAQDVFVEFLASRLVPGDPKTLEGYLLLLTPSVIPNHARHRAFEIRRDTKYVRKLLGTADDMPSLRTVLLPVLPLEVEEPDGWDVTPVVRRLPEVIRKDDLPRGAVQTVADAFLADASMMEALHRWVADQGHGDSRQDGVS